MCPGEHPLRVASRTTHHYHHQYKYYNHTIHQASEEIISQRIALNPRLYIHIIIVTIHLTHNVSPWGTAVTDNCVGLCFPVYSGLRLATSVCCAGLLRTMPDYFQTTSNHAGLLPVYSGQLGRTQGFSAPVPRADLLGAPPYTDRWPKFSGH